MSTSLVRIPLTLAAAFAFHVSMSPPSASEADSMVGSGDKRAACTTAARFASAMLTKGLFWASALADAFIVLAPYVPTSRPAIGAMPIPPASAVLAWIKRPTSLGPGSDLVASLALSVPFPPLPPVTVAGTTLALAGACLRHAAYRALGRFYACPNRSASPCHARGHAHALITTGPYAVVRHPGYAGLALCTTGLVLLQLDALGAGGVFGFGFGFGLGTSVGMRMVAVVCAVLATVGALRKIRDEERSLRARFKGEWEAWAKNVPYRLLPGVY